MKDIFLVTFLCSEGFEQIQFDFCSKKQRKKFDKLISRKYSDLISIQRIL